MIESISIKNLGLIEKAEVEFNPKFTVFTGETGAGKTMFLDSLKYILGKRNQANSVNEKTNKATISTYFEKIDKTFFEENEIDYDSSLIINRVLYNDGKSRAVVNDVSHSVKFLSKIGSELVLFHGQNDQTFLKDSSKQLEILDSFGSNKHKILLESFKTEYRSFLILRNKSRKSSEELERLEKSLKKIRSFVKDFENVDPELNEIKELTDELNRLSNIDEIKNNYTTGLQNIYNEDFDSANVNEMLSEFIFYINKNKDKKISNLAYETKDLFDELVKETISEIEDLDSKDLSEMPKMEDRLKSLENLEKKYDKSIQELTDEYTESYKLINDLEEDYRSFENIDKDVEKSELIINKIAQKIKESRILISMKLSEKINVELEEMNMKDSIFTISFIGDVVNSSGLGSVEFCLKKIGSSKIVPVNKYASGGELSRIMLALELVLSENSSIDTFVFDEIDSGIGGETAILVGKKLKKLSESKQIIVVSHLPQVAAFANEHYLISKEITSEIKSTINLLNHDNKVNEIARMLSGTVNNTSKKHAEELLSK